MADEIRTVKEIADAKQLTPLQRQMIVGYCNDANIITEEDLTKRKIENRRMFRQCVDALNKSNTTLSGKPYINIVDEMTDIKDNNDFYVIATTFGFRFYNLMSDDIGTPSMKLTRMLATRCNNLRTCYITAGKHNGLPYHYTGMLLAYVPNKYYKVNQYQTIDAHYNGYKVW